MLFELLAAGLCIVAVEEECRDAEFGSSFEVCGSVIDKQTFGGVESVFFEEQLIDLRFGFYDADFARDDFAVKVFVDGLLSQEVYKFARHIGEHIEFVPELFELCYKGFCRGYFALFADSFSEHTFAGVGVAVAEAADFIFHLVEGEGAAVVLIPKEGSAGFGDKREERQKFLAALAAFAGENDASQIENYILQLHSCSICGKDSHFRLNGQFG